MLDRLMRVPGKLITVLFRRDPDCSLGKAVRDIWSGHKRPEAIHAMSARLALKDTDKDGFELWDTPLGDLWAPAGSGLSVVLAELETGVYTSDSHQVELRDGDVVIDCGAHIGVFCRHALNCGAKKVLAVEITPETQVCLERNLADAIADGRVEIVTKGVWSSETTLELSTGKGSLSNTVSTERSQIMGHSEAETVSVPVTTLDSLVRRHGIDTVDFIKMDIEGAEREALVGAAEILRKDKPRMAIASYHLPDDRGVIRAKIVASQPGYAEELGPCIILHGRVLPETLFYS